MISVPTLSWGSYYSSSGEKLGVVKEIAQKWLI